MPMLSFILKRVLATVPVMGVVALTVFLLLRLSPGDPAAVIAGDYATAEQIEKIRTQLGLDRADRSSSSSPGSVKLVRGDLGVSIFSNLPVTTLIGAAHRADADARAHHNRVLDRASRCRSACSPPGRRDTWVDRAVMVFAVVGFSVPVFVMGYFLIYGFRDRPALVSRAGLPLAVRRSGPVHQPHHAADARALGDLHRADRAHHARERARGAGGGLHPHRARQGPDRAHACCCVTRSRNAAVPIVTVIGLGVALLIGGVVVTESVFNIPGLGRLVVDAILKRDYPIIQGLILFFSFLYIAFNLLIDIAYTLLDPRIRY